MSNVEFAFRFFDVYPSLTLVEASKLLKNILARCLLPTLCLSEICNASVNHHRFRVGNSRYPKLEVRVEIPGDFHCGVFPGVNQLFWRGTVYSSYPWKRTVLQCAVRGLPYWWPGLVFSAERVVLGGCLVVCSSGGS